MLNCDQRLVEDSWAGEKLDCSNKATLGLWLARNKLSPPVPTTRPAMSRRGMGGRLTHRHCQTSVRVDGRGGAGIARTPGPKGKSFSRRCGHTEFRSTEVPYEQTHVQGVL